MYRPMQPGMGQPMGTDPLAAADPMMLYRIFMQQQIDHGPQTLQQWPQIDFGPQTVPQVQQPTQRGLGGFGDMGLMGMSQLRGLLGQQGAQSEPEGGFKWQPKTPPAQANQGIVGGILGMLPGAYGGAKSPVAGGILASEPGYGFF